MGNVKINVTRYDYIVVNQAMRKADESEHLNPQELRSNARKKRSLSTHCGATKYYGRMWKAECAKEHAGAAIALCCTWHIQYHG